MDAMGGIGRPCVDACHAREFTREGIHLPSYLKEHYIASIPLQNLFHITTNINTNHQTFSLRTSASYISHLSILFTTCIRFRVLPLLTNLPTTTRTSVWTLYPEGPGHFFPIPVFTTTVSGSAFLDPCFEPVVVFFGLNDCSFS